MKSSVPLPSELVKRLAKIPSLRAVILFGSWARGEADRKSDMDLLLVFDRREDITKNNQTLLRLLKRYKEFPLAFTKRSVKDLTRDPSFIYNVLREGYLLYKKPDTWLLPPEISSAKDVVIYTYNLRGLTHRQKLKFNSSIHTRSKGRYRYPGLVERVGGRKLGFGALVVPAHAEKELDEIFKSHRVKPEKIHAFILKPIK
jgi:predicted nucleotidyltransferase